MAVPLGGDCLDQGAATSVAGNGESSTAGLVAGLSRFEGPPGEFLNTLIEVQCRVADARGGAIIGVGGNGEAEKRLRVLALHPPIGIDGAPPVWLAQSSELAPRVLSSGETRIVPVRGMGVTGNGADEHVVMLPLQGGAGSQAVAAYLVCALEQAILDRARERLELTIGLLSLYEMRLRIQAGQTDMQRLRLAMEVLAALNEHDRLKPSAMAFCNELAARFNAERVTLGFLKGRYVKTVAISHTEKFDRKMKLVQDLESAMEECLDQDVEVVHPPAPESTAISRAAAGLSARHGPTFVVSLPLRRGGEPIAVTTLECPAEKPLPLDQIETLRLTSDLCTARLVDLYETDKWIGAKAAGAAREGFSHLLGPTHTWAKLAAVAVIAFVLFAVLAKGRDRIDASFDIQPVEQRSVPAAFDGRLQTVNVEPGSIVVAGETVLGTLETAELQLRLAAARAERAGYIKEADLALREKKTVEVQIAEASRRKVEAEMRLLEHQIAKASLVAPIDGTVVSDDLKRQLGAPVQTGDVLFEIAPLHTLRAVLQVPEDRMTDLLATGGDGKIAGGTLASVAHPGDYIEFEVERVNPVAEVVDQKNVFEVRVRLLQTRPWLRPGMKGVAKVEVGRRAYASLWTRKAVNWVRMKLWI